jgi:hypothetical protein
MSEFVFILGAGASAHAKVPVMAKFLDRARELYSPNMDPRWKEHFERVLSILSALQNVHSKAELDLNNLEAVFTAFELGQTIRKLPGVGDDMDFEAAVNSLKALIVNTIEQSMLFPLDEERCLVGSIDYANFASFVLALIQKHRIRFKGVTIITFNYDIGAEVAFERGNLPYDYFVGQQEPLGNVVKLLKLHGSINWGQDLNSDEIVPIPVQRLLSTPIFTNQSTTHLPLVVSGYLEQSRAYLKPTQ